MRTKTPLRKRSRTSEEQYQDEAFQLLMKRFDRVDQDNKDIKEALSDHIKEDAKVHATVERQSTYWGLLLTLGTPTILGLIAWFTGLLGR